MRGAVHSAPKTSVEVFIDDTVGMLQHSDEGCAVPIFVYDWITHPCARRDLGKHLERAVL